MSYFEILGFESTHRLTIYANLCLVRVLEDCGARARDCDSYLIRTGDNEIEAKAKIEFRGHPVEASVAGKLDPFEAVQILCHRLEHGVEEIRDAHHEAGASTRTLPNEECFEPWRPRAQRETWAHAARAILPKSKKHHA